MSTLWPPLVYILCLLASILCAALLVRAWWLGRSRLLLWTAIAFGFFALNNLALVADMMVFTAPLWPFRLVPTILALGVLLYGFIWETDR